MRAKRYRLRLSVATLVSVCLLLGSMPAALAQDARTDRGLPDAVKDLKLKKPRERASLTAEEKVALGLRAARGPQNVVVQLSQPAVAEVAATGQSAAGQRQQKSRVQVQQRGVINAASRLDRNARVLGTTQSALNAVILRIDAAEIAALAANPAVVSIRPVRDYERHDEQRNLGETVPYIGGSAVHDVGFTGEGIRVAVLDSGIDYTHVAFGGAGTAAAYEAAYGTSVNDPRNTSRDGLFPTDKVIGGWDFVGEAWTGGAGSPPLAPDPDPIDCGPVTIPAPCDGGHGTHVAHIIAGVGGVAPDARLYAVKVCSAVSTSCSGVALLQGIDFAVDPNGDGSTADAVDIINMSLGAPYGQAFDDDLSQAVENATKVGVLTVASAGNSSDKPYVTGSPAAAPSALSVAQTAVPSSIQLVMDILSPASIAGSYAAVHQPWSAEVTSAIEAPAQYGDGAGGNLNGCAAFPAGSLAGLIVLVDRGACDFSLKITNVANGGGLVGIIGLVAPGDPFEGGLGACPDGACGDIPGFMIHQSTSNAIKSGLAAGEVVIRFDPATGIPLVGHMVGSSSRGPTMLTNVVKPEIGAPGASVSAEAGTGEGETPFGGTSGAAPMVAGSAALLMDAYGSRRPHEIKSVLMNSAETNIMNAPELFGGTLAPISRIGGGEVRVDRALASKAAAWDRRSRTGVVNFGFHDVTQTRRTLTRHVVVRNYTNRPIHYDVSADFRFQNDRNNGAVSVRVPKRVTVPPRGARQFPVHLTIKGNKLRPWTMNSGSRGADPGPLTLHEYDGYIWLDDRSTTLDDDRPLHLAWHVLPRAAGNVVRKANGDLRNKGIEPAPVESYSLLATSPNLPEGGPGEQSPTPDIRRAGVQTYPVPAGFCSANNSFIWAFAFNTWERQTHAIAPAEFQVWLDVDQDGVDDYVVFTADVGLGLSDGRVLTWVFNLNTGSLSAFFFADHDTNSGNMVMLICGEQIGMNAADFFDPVDSTYQVVDWYFGGPGDGTGTLTIAPLGERYLGLVDGSIFATIAPKTNADVEILDFGPVDTNPGELGVLLLFRDGAPAAREALEIHISP
ncbi:MAG TPA: S8 family serine peptidase [Candidatus Limnocylindria bacterium]|nr:S8 family serine peptidase [Candidatus Limnocylindria bacterium]